MLSVKDGAIRQQASIKHQCARHKFYGDETTENELSRLETKHALALHRLLKFARGGPDPLPDDDYTIREAVLLQRHRTTRAAAISAANLQALRLGMFKHFVEALKEPDLRAHGRQMLAAGRVGFEDSTLALVLQSLNFAVVGVPLIKDLQLAILRNQTSNPFILSDAPSIAYNLFAWEYPRRGALGNNSRGLMFLLPLTPAIQLVLCDPQVYRFSMTQEPFVDVTTDRDVAQLNTLQLFSAQENAYFADNGSVPYVRQLYQDIRAKMLSQTVGFIEHPSGTMLLDGKFNDGEIMQN